MNEICERQLQWCIDLGVFYINGRDVCWFIIGFLCCLVLWAMFDGKEIKWK